MLKSFLAKKKINLAKDFAEAKPVQTGTQLVHNSNISKIKYKGWSD